MSRPLRLLSVLACVAAACALSATAAPAKQGVPSNGHGVVLGLSGHTVRLVDRGHRVGDVHVSSTHGLRRGDVVSVRDGRAHVSGRVHKLSFLGRVVKSTSCGAVVRLGDGSTLNLGGGGRAPRAHRAAVAAANVTISFQGLAPGQTLLVTISTDDQGNVAITVKVMPASTDIGAAEQQVSGVVTDDTGGGMFAIRASDGSGLRFEDPQQLFDAADASLCDTVDVSYHQDGRALVADAVKVTGQSQDGACADPQTDEVDGTVTALAPDGSSLTVAPDDGSAAQMISTSDASVVDGISVGDHVAVTLDQDGTAVDVELLDVAGDQGGSGSGDQSSGSGDQSGGDGSGDA